MKSFGIEGVCVVMVASADQLIMLESYFLVISQD